MNFKVLIYSILLSLGIMATVAASNTDNLKQQYADGNFYIEYKLTKQNSKGEMLKYQKQELTHPFDRFDKFIYAQIGENKYYQRNDFAENPNHGVYSKARKSWLDYYHDNIMLEVQHEPISESFLYELEHGKVNSNDVNIVKDGKIYALNRFDMTGYWTTVEEIAANPKLEQIVCINMIIPTIFNSILFNDKNMLAECYEEEIKHVLSEDLLCETYTAQKINEYGSPVGEKWYFQLFYKDGKLVCFSDALSEAYYRKLNNKPLKFLNKVNVLSKVTNESIFDAMANYEVQKFEVQ